MKRHNWIKIGSGKKKCVTCNIINFSTKADDGYNTIWKFYYPHNTGMIIDKNPGCK